MQRSLEGRRRRKKKLNKKFKDMKAKEKILEKALVTKRFLNMVAKFKEDIKAFAEESGEEEANQEEAAEAFAAFAAPESGEARKADILAKLAAAPESGEAAADLLKMSAAVAFGFVGFYLTFAIFGI